MNVIFAFLRNCRSIRRPHGWPPSPERFFRTERHLCLLGWFNQNQQYSYPMLSTAAQQLLADIKAYIGKAGLPANYWYVGIAADIDQRLFGDHRVSKELGTWIYGEAPTHHEAREIEAWLHSAGCKGGPGGGDHETRFVYAYMITQSTVE